MAYAFDSMELLFSFIPKPRDNIVRIATSVLAVFATGHPESVLGPKGHPHSLGSAKKA
jgi:hypothetical protein